MKKVKGLKFSGPNTAPDGREIVDAVLTMPCGHIIRHEATVAEHELGLTGAKEKLEYWFANAIPWHDCKLVGKDTPSGLMPIDQRKDATGHRMAGPYDYLLTEAAQTA